VGHEHWAIEVKASRQVDIRDLKGLEGFAEHARKVTRRIVVFLGARRQWLDDVEVLAAEGFPGGTARIGETQ
jgi:hypothetical protein